MQTIHTLLYRYSTHMDVKDNLMFNLKQLVEMSGARIVWTTYWRGFRAYLDFMLYRFELEPSAGATLGRWQTTPTTPTRLCICVLEIILTG